MRIALLFVAGWNVLGTLLVVGTMGRERKPTTPASACVTVVLNAAMVVVLVLAAKRLG